MIYIVTFAVGCALGIRAYIRHRGTTQKLFCRKGITDEERARYLDWCAQTLIENEQQAESNGDL